jgi:hypothetical protein
VIIYTTAPPSYDYCNNERRLIGTLVMNGAPVWAVTMAERQDFQVQGARYGSGCYPHWGDGIEGRQALEVKPLVEPIVVIRQAAHDDDCERWDYSCVVAGTDYLLAPSSLGGETAEAQCRERVAALFGHDTILSFRPE